MKEILILLILAIWVHPSFSQSGTQETGTLMGGNNIFAPAPRPGVTIGSNYLDAKWNIATITLFQSNKILEGYPVKYDLKENRLEVKTLKKIELVETKKIKTLVWKDSITQSPKTFVNGSEYTENGAPLTGLLEVLTDGKARLLKRNSIFVKNPDFVPELGIGNRDTKISTEVTFYYASGSEVTKIANRKSLLHCFGDESADVKKFMKANNLSVNSEHDITRVFEYYNSNSRR